jgi:putative ABC transport system permease protein
MNFSESIRIAMRNLQVNVLRSVLTMLGIIIGVAAVITMMALGTGARTEIVAQLRTLGANLLLINPGSQSAGGVRFGARTRHSLTEEDAAAISAEIPFLNAVAPGVEGRAQVVRGNANWATSIVGTVPDHLVAREWEVAAGRVFTPEEVDTAAKAALIGATVAEKLFEDADPLDQLIRIHDVPFTIIGVLKAKGQSAYDTDQDDVIFVPLSTAKLRLMGSALSVDRRAVEFIYVKVAAEEAIAEAKDEIEQLLRQRHDLPPRAPDDFEVRDLAAAVAAREQATRTFTLFFASVASLSLVVGGISIMNIMLVSVTERTREIGLRLAMGARRRDIRSQFLIEAVTLCLIGGIAGIGLGVLSVHILGKATGWTVVISPLSPLLAVAYAAAVGVFFGFFPAYKASRLGPMEALRSD